MSVAIALQNVSAAYRLGDKPVTLLEHANLELLPGRYAVVAPTAAAMRRTDHASRATLITWLRRQVA